MRRLLGDTQTAFKLLMETVREKEAACEALEGQVEALRAEAEGARRQRDEAAARLQVRRDGVAGWAHTVVLLVAGWRLVSSQAQRGR